MSHDRTYFITASKDKTAKIIDVDELRVLKTYVTDTPLNTAALTARKDFVILGGGQEARDVTTTSTRSGKFEARFYHKIFEDEIGRVRGHFGPLNTIAAHPKGLGYASGLSRFFFDLCPTSLASPSCTHHLSTTPPFSTHARSLLI